MDFELSSQMKKYRDWHHEDANRIVDKEAEKTAMSFTDEASAEQSSFFDKLRERSRGAVKVLAILQALELTPSVSLAQRLMKETDTEQDTTTLVETMPDSAISEDTTMNPTETEKADTSYFRLESQEGEVPPDLLQHLECIYFHVVNNGEVKPIVLTAAELAQNPRIKIDGYISNVFVKGSEPMTVTLDGQPAASVNKMPASDFMYLDGLGIKPEQFATAQHDAKFFNTILNETAAYDSVDNNALPVLRGAYTIGEESSITRFAGMAPYTGEPASPNTNLELTITFRDQEFSIPIEQLSYQTIMTTDSRFGAKTEVLYLGDHPEEYADGASQEKINASLAGIERVENIAQMNLVDTVRLIDYKYDNAKAETQRPIITYIGNHLKEQTPEENMLTAEHETLHQYVKKRRFVDNVEIRKYFGTLKGYSGAELNELEENGYIWGEEMDSYNNEPTFAFISESNFLNAPGGHPQSHLYEFITSFTHTLMEINRMAERLESPITIKHQFDQNEIRSLTTDEKLSVLQTYHELIDVMLHHTHIEAVELPDKQQRNHEREFFTRARDQIISLEKKLN